MSKYRRIEVNAFRRRVTIISGEWLQDNPQPAQFDDGVLVNDTDSCEPIRPDSPEGQLILVEAVRSLERRLSPEARAEICAGRTTSGDPSAQIEPVSSQARIPLSVDLSKAFRFARKEK